ncbi:hypothetical protein CCACVL1_23186 [Corchorus capsularis]|uniref:Uncharacterized protein n=1 Tax=Corchorus capsularis TaxID=210143 RepID=A0A1R3GUY1_COCAP|nr:hypothetical protein CCACVL1_23186 [Corchorus capsularis]
MKMARFGVQRSVLRSLMLNFLNFALAFMLVSAERSLKNGESSKESESSNNYFKAISTFLWQSDQSGYQHVWPEAARRLESNGTGNVEVEYKPLPSGPNSEAPKDNTDKQVGTSVKAYFKGVETWKRETVLKQEAAKFLESSDTVTPIMYKTLPCGASNDLTKEIDRREVASATATFGMTFSSSMSVVEYYLLNRFPVPYALYFIVVSIIAALVGQHIVDKLIRLTGRESIIIFVLAFTIFVSTIALGGVGISSMVEKIEHKEYMGFENLCISEG